MLASAMGKQGWEEEINPAEKDAKRSEFLKELKIKKSIYYPVNTLGVLAVSLPEKVELAKKEKLFIHDFLKINLQPSLVMAIENESNIERATRDQMTGLYNHAYFKIRLKEEASLALRDKTRSLSLIMIDIDFFKHYNDTNGHPKGDAVIKRIAEIMRSSTRSSDIAARYGGEEFAILMPNAQLTDAALKADKIRSEVEKTAFENESVQPNKRITISVGLASMPAHAISAESLLDSADKALYYSKNNGKNRVTVYTKSN
ncbi:GGDEF domain-containing protein [Patescibacteria group bacterium]|nr:GGDEF domain-containing protein [Patescibacteria group bacterium]